MTADREGDIRCYCTRRPLLAKFGRDKGGLLYVHTKVYKQGKIFGEAIFTRGVVHLRCRECLRWYRIRIRQMSDEVTYNQEPLPDNLDQMLAQQ